MTYAVHFVNYQGIPCKAAQYRRSDGLSPEPGFVIVDYADLKTLEFKDDAVPWRGISESKEDPGGISIHVWHQLKGTATVAETPRKFDRGASGLRLYGPLVLTTVMHEGGAGDSITYSDVYVANADEVMEDLAEARLHKTGEIRIDLTDIRKFYPRYGCLIGRINCHLRNGRYDPTTVKKPGSRRAAGRTTTVEELNGTPWSFVEVMSYLFSQLPGSPRVAFDKGVANLRPPEEIDQIGAPILSVIESLLDNYRLTAKMQPHGNYWLCRKNEKVLSPGQVFTEMDRRKVGTPPFISYEKKSVSYVDAPTVVMVLGRPRVRRRTEIFVSVFQDLDGHTYQLAEIDKVWKDYSLLQVNTQASKGTEKNFANVPPRPPRRALTDADREAALRGRERELGTKDFEAIRDLHYRRRDIMRQQAYRLYAPKALFNDSCSRNANGAIQMMDPDNDWIEFLPMGPAPFPASATAKDIELGMDLTPRRVSDIALHPPIVRAYRLGSVLEIDPNAAVALLDAAIKKEQALQDFWEFERELKGELLAEATELSQRAEEALKNAPQLTESGGFLGIGRGRLGAGGSIFQDARKAMEDYKRALSNRDILRQHKDQVRSSIDGLTKAINASALQLVQWKKRRGDILLAIREEGGIHVAQSQLPYGVCPQNTYSLDPYTGLLSFSGLACIIDPPILHDPNSGEVIGDGHVTVTFGFESHWNEPADYTNVLFGRDEKGNVQPIGVSATSPYKPHVVHDPELVLYEGDRGFPMNMNDVLDQAAKKAVHKLVGERTTEGYATQFGGFVKCNLGPGVDSVQHDWAGDDAYTYVAVNAPSWIGPVGPAAVKKASDQATSARQFAKRAEGGVA